MLAWDSGIIFFSLNYTFFSSFFSISTSAGVPINLFINETHFIVPRLKKFRLKNLVFTDQAKY